MRKLRRIISLMGNSDIRSFIRYTAVHPKTIMNRVDSSKYPAFISKEDLVSLDELDNCLSIHKLRFIDDNVSQGEYAIQNILKIHLAGIDEVINISNIDWFKDYSDSEDVAALHRFLWLYRLVWEKCSHENIELNKQIKQIIYDWIDRVESINKEHVHSEVWQTYSVVERITNWLIVLGLTETENTTDTIIIDSILRQLDYIQYNFEYYGEKFTSNHFFNDGKGLYICGAVMGHIKYRELGKKIIKGMFDKIVPDGFFLREGSSHYQFLVTKWLCDCMWIARESSDYEFAEWIKPRLTGMMKGSMFFLNKTDDKWMIPYIGDISPDLYPDWVIGVPWVASYLVNNSFCKPLPIGEGYHSVLSQKIPNAFESEVGLRRSNDWAKIQNENFVIYSHVNNSLYPNNLTGHFHHDSGSIVVYADSRPLLIDCGRTNYNAEGIGIWEKGRNGHNLCVIDDVDPEPDMRAFYSESFEKDRFGIPPLVDCNDSCFQVKIEYGKRVKNLDKQFRSVNLLENRIVIKDKIGGKGEHDLKLLFHVSNTWKVDISDGAVIIRDSKEEYLIRTDGISYNIVTNVYDDTHYGYFADEYGAKKRCTTIVGTKKIVPEDSIVTIIERIKR